MTHPLTDKKAFKKFYDHTVDVEMECLYTPDGIRAAADWQLKKVIAFLRKNLDERYVDDGDLLAPGIDAESVIVDLKRKMRPIQEDS